MHFQVLILVADRTGNAESHGELEQPDLGSGREKIQLLFITLRRLTALRTRMAVIKTKKNSLLTASYTSFVTYEVIRQIRHPPFDSLYGNKQFFKWNHLLDHPLTL
jgi:hypothetical protein